MSDRELRELERQAAQNPGDEGIQGQLFRTRIRAGTGKIVTFWKVKEKNKAKSFWNGKTGPDYNYYNSKDKYFTSTGKEWTSKEELYKILVKGSQSAVANLADRLKKCVVVEYQAMTLEASRTEAEVEIERAELEILRAQKEENLKKIRELEEKEKKLLNKLTPEPEPETKE